MTGCVSLRNSISRQNCSNVSNAAPPAYLRILNFTETEISGALEHGSSSNSSIRAQSTETFSRSQMEVPHQGARLLPWCEGMDVEPVASNRDFLNDFR